MKKAVVLFGMVLALGMVANVALSDETVIFPFWQKGYGLQTFYSVANGGGTNMTVTVEQLNFDGSFHSSTTATVLPGTCWAPDTGLEGWCTTDGLGFGRYIIVASEDACHTWSCLYSWVPDIVPGVAAQPGFTMTMPGNPYGN